MSYVDFNVVACVVACDNFEGVRTVIQNYKNPNSKLKAGLLLGPLQWVLFVFFVSFLFLIWFGYKMYIWLSNYKKKYEIIQFVVVFFFFRKEWQTVFFKLQLRIHNINNAYLIALDNCYYVKIKLDCVYLSLNSSK